jgi:hypothetical protein
MLNCFFVKKKKAKLYCLADHRTKEQIFSQEPPIRKTIIPICAQNDVIEHPDREHLAALFEASRNFMILLARHRVAGRMIVQTTAAALRSSAAAYTSPGRIRLAVSVPVEITL